MFNLFYYPFHNFIAVNKNFQIDIEQSEYFIGEYLNNFSKSCGGAFGWDKEAIRKFLRKNFRNV